MAEKHCCRCKQTKDLSEFNRLSSSPDGHRLDCKTCIKAYRDAHKEQIQASMRICVERNGTRYNANRMAKYYASDGHVHRLPEIERFWAHVQKSDEPAACWLWTGSCNPDGYGTFHREPHVSAHRFAWELENGPIPEAQQVLHHCDVPNCVRNDGMLSHLFLGSQLENIADRVQKGRSANWRLPDSEVYEIRHLEQFLSQEEVAEIYHISCKQVRSIWKRRRYDYIP